MKRFSEIVRFNYTINLLKKNHLSLTALTYEAGYYDEPHMIRAFKKTVGLTPLHFSRNMSDYYNEPLKF